MSVGANIARVRESVGRKPVTLIAVTKQATVAQIEEAFSAGVTEFGENRLQTALAKREELAPEIQQGSRWHFIGHLQTNKVKLVIGNFELIHSVDSFHLAEQISKTAKERGVRQAILLQVKIAEDPSKYGFSPEQLEASFKQMSSFDNLDIKGLMTITPQDCTRETTIKCFDGLRELRNELSKEHKMELHELSMGMSDDWQDAMASGATMIRLGRAIFSN
jgi:pyridoxal phosphate enzyme (YggS family)